MIKRGKLNLILNNFIPATNSTNTSGSYYNENSNFEFLIEDFSTICNLLKNKNVIILEDLLTFIVNKKAFVNVTLFYENLSQILKNFNKETQNKIVLFKLFGFLENFDMNNPLPPPELKQNVILLIKHLDEILKIADKNENDELIMIFYNLFNKFDIFIINSALNWRESINFIKALKK